MGKRRLAILAVASISLAGLILQTLLIRELLNTFSGVELSLSVVLSCWLLGAGIGALAFRRIIKNTHRTQISYFIISLSTAVLAILSLFIAGLRKGPFISEFFRVIPFSGMVALSCFLVIPVSVVLGAAFLLSVKLLSESGREEPAVLAYICDGAGCAAAGLIFTFLLAGRFTSFAICLASALYLFLLSAALVFASKSPRAVIFPLVISVFLLSLFFFGAPQALRERANRIRYPGQEVLSSSESRYGRMDIVRQGAAVLIYEGGSLYGTSEDLFFNEEMAHVSMLIHPDPKEVLLMGSPFLAPEILKHPVKRLTYVETDPLTIKEISRFLPEMAQVFSDSRVNLRYADSRFFLTRKPGKYDLIIVNLPDPNTLLLNRYYTREFYRLAEKNLASGGILIVRVSSAEEILPYATALYNLTVIKSLENVFPHLFLVPGETLIIAASRDPISAPAILLQKRFAERGLKTEFFTTRHLAYRLRPERLAYLSGELEAVRGKAVVNSDLKPEAFTLLFFLSGMGFNPSALRHIQTLKSALPFLILIVFLAMILAGILCRQRGRLPAVAIFILSFSGLSFQLISLLLFQAAIGFLYSFVGLLSALFLTGLSLAGWISLKIKDKFKEALSLISLAYPILSLLLLAGLPLMISQPCQWWTRFYSSAYGRETVVCQPVLAGTGLGVLSFLAGSVVGAAFSVAVRLNQKGREAVSSAGFLYAVDLAGAAFGGLVTAFLFIPFLGIPGAVVLIASLNLILFFHLKITFPPYLWLPF